MSTPAENTRQKKHSGQKLNKIFAQSNSVTPRKHNSQRKTLQKDRAPWKANETVDNSALIHSWLANSKKLSSPIKNRIKQLGASVTSVEATHQTSAKYCDCRLSVCLDKISIDGQQGVFTADINMTEIQSTSSEDFHSATNMTTM